MDLFIDAYEEALDTLSAQAAEHPEFADVQHRLGLLFYVAGDPEHALERHERAVSINPRYTAAFSALGYAIARVRGEDAALAHWQAGLAKEPRPAHPNEHAGLALDVALALGRRGEAGAALEVLEPVRPQGRHRYLVERERMLLLAYAGRTDEAQAIRERLGGLSPLLAELLVDAGFTKGTLESPERVALSLGERDPNYNIAEINLYIGVTYAAFAARTMAEDAFRAALAADFDLTAFHVQMGRLYALEGDEERAAGEFSRALAIDPDHVRARIDLGYELAGLGRIEEAITQFAAAARIAPSYPDVHHQLGLLYTESERPPEAEAAFRLALELRPNFGLARASLALLYARNGRDAEALAEYERVIASGLRSADIYLSIGLIQHRLGNTERAIEALRRGARLNPRYAAIHYHLGRIFQERGQRARAYAAWRRFFHYAEETSLVDRLDLFKNSLRRDRLELEAAPFAALDGEHGPDHGPAAPDLAA